MHSNFTDNFLGYISRHELFTRGDKILLTVSGGVDSMVMLSLLVATGYNVGVAHCNFCLRGAESDEDEVVVEEEAKRYGVPFYNRRFDTAGEMERTGESMEMAARRLRYTWFNELCAEHGYTVIAVAHHIDDSIETFFINLLRGTGLKGLTGIHSQMGRVVRPLMFASRKDILEYAVANRIPFREDSSNRSTKYLRNKIRLGLLPMIREINPKFTPMMRGNLRRLDDAQNFIRVMTGKIAGEIIESHGGIDTIHADRIDPALPRDFVLYEILNSAYGFKGDVVDSLCKALEGGQSGRRFYSREYVACTDRGTVAVSRITEDDACESSLDSDAMRAYCGASVLYFDHTDIDNVTDFCVPQDVALLDERKLQYPLTLRRWREGDSFVPFGMNERKKVSDFLIDAKVSMLEKSRQFVLLSGGDIVWLVGRRTDNRYRITDSTEEILKITRENI